MELKENYPEDENVETLADDFYIKQIKPYEDIKPFLMHYELLLRRYRRYSELNSTTTIYDTHIDKVTYFDMLIVQLRALCIENSKRKKNFTAQNVLKKFGREDLACKIDKMLDEFLIEEMNLTIREALKIIADKYVCHYDYFDIRSGQLSIERTIEALFNNPCAHQNIDYIMSVLIKCIKDGLGIGLDDIKTEKEIQDDFFKPRDF